MDTYPCTPKELTYTSLRSDVSSVDTITHVAVKPVGAVSVKEVAGESGVLRGVNMIVVCPSFAGATDSATIKIFGWPIAGRGQLLEEISVSADSTWRVANNGYYGGVIAEVDVTGFSWVYAYVTTISSGGVVSIDMLRI